MLNFIIAGLALIGSISAIKNSGNETKSSGNVYYGSDANYWENNGGYDTTDLNG
jgi:hypothetical protein